MLNKNTALGDNLSGTFVSPKWPSQDHHVPVEHPTCHPTSKAKHKNAEVTLLCVTAKDFEVQKQRATNAEETPICITAMDFEVQKQRAKMPKKH